MRTRTEGTGLEMKDLSPLSGAKKRMARATQATTLMYVGDTGEAIGAQQLAIVLSILPFVCQLIGQVVIPCGNDYYPHGFVFAS